MTVRRKVKDRRCAIETEYERREYERTGRDVFEQWQDRALSVAPIHEKINRRAEDEQALIPWWPGQTRKDREREWTKRSVVHPDDAKWFK
jgi:hypothetical protein